jgi:protein-arginine kinase activator protein McsA
MQKPSCHRPCHRSGGRRGACRGPHLHGLLPGAGLGAGCAAAAGLKFSEYQQINLFGCAHDWTGFAEPVGELVRRWHGAGQHVGRRPGDAAPAEIDARRAELTTELAAAVAGERYEEAATLRDRLRRLGDGA